MPIISACTQTPATHFQKGSAALRAKQFSEAEQEFKISADVARKKQDARAEAESLRGLARTLIEQGRYHEARPLLQQSVADLEKLYGRQSSEVAAALIELSACWYNQHAYKEAEPLCLEALGIEQKAAKPNHSIIATALNNLAEISKRRGEDVRAEDYYKQAIALYKTKPGQTSVQRGLIETYSNLAMLYKRQGRYDLAKKIMAEAFDTQAKISANDAVAMASVLNTLASIERAQFDNAAATDHYKRAVELLSKNEKANEEALCDTLDNYADLLLDERNHTEAEKNYLVAIEYCKRSRGPDHPCVAERMTDLAILYRRLGKYDRAEELLKRALAINMASFDSDSPIVVNTINDLSAVYLDRKKYAKADALFASWVPKLVIEVGQHHPHVADALENWAMVAGKSQAADHAADLRRQAKSIRAALTKPAAKERSAEPDKGEITLDPDKHGR